jgi:hypothetical protein
VEQSSAVVTGSSRRYHRSRRDTRGDCRPTGAAALQSQDQCLRYAQPYSNASSRVTIVHGNRHSSPDLIMHGSRSSGTLRDAVRQRIVLPRPQPRRKSAEASSQRVCPECSSARVITRGRIHKPLTCVAFMNNSPLASSVFLLHADTARRRRHRLQ